MFLNSNSRLPFENRTNGNKTSKFKSDKEPKRPVRQRTWEKETKKNEEACQVHKNAFKEFMKPVKELENAGLVPVLTYLHRALRTLPRALHWQVFMELADVAKRENRISEARRMLELSVSLNPYAHQAWLEYSKLEEECGKMSESRKHLLVGIQFSPYCEQLFIKFLKIEEKIGDVSVSRQILGSLFISNVEKNWKIILEGALMEAREGKISLARHILQNLVYVCSTFGAVYLEAIKFEEKWGKDLQYALDLCEKGLNRNLRYGPLWFSMLRILEKSLQAGANSNEIRRKQENLLQDADSYLSKELLWKLYLDQAVYLEKANKFEASREYLKEAVYTAPDNLRWKAWVTASRVELRAGFKDRAVKLLKAAVQEVPVKQKPLVLVEVSQAYELMGNLDRAREFMDDACEKSKQDWKIYLERINLEMRAGEFKSALSIVKEAVSKYFSTGRLWASLIQILHTDSSSISQGLHFKAFLLAVQEVPKSGEVWCEGARIRLNPYSEFFDLGKAEEYLNYAIQFTPQYGDSFIELMRVYYLKGQLDRFRALKRLCVNADPNYGTLWFYCKSNSLDGPREVWKKAKELAFNEITKTRTLYIKTAGKDLWANQLWIGLSENVWSFTRNYVLDFAAKAKLIYGSESLII